MAQTMIITSDGENMFFDAALKISHEAEVTTTSHPIQSGAEITDHSIIQPESVSMEIGMSDVMSDGAEHSVNAYLALKELMRKREPVTLVTRLQSYDDMLLVSISTSDSFETMNSLKAVLSFRHLEIVDVATVTIQNKTTSSKSGGSKKVKADEVESVSTDKTSILYDLLGGRTASEYTVALIKGEL